ncbi:hypothetical protein DEA98_14065 [Brucella pseudogrignonensis]|nr:hypothetical protein [Brucella pseudogrignonensis]
MEVTYYVGNNGLSGVSKACKSLEAAKAAAQADYEARILSAIEVAQSPRAQALEEAARLADAQADKIDLTGMDRTRSITKYLAAQKVALLDAAAAIRALSSKPVAGRCKTVDELAAYLCDEFDFDLNPVRGASWPEHENDEGKRDGGYVRLQPSDVQAYARENAKRILAFLGLPASPGASE